MQFFHYLYRYTFIKNSIAGYLQSTYILHIIKIYIAFIHIILYYVYCVLARDVSSTKSAIPTHYT